MQDAHPPQLRIEKVSQVEKAVEQPVECRDLVRESIHLGIEQDEEKQEHRCGEAEG